MNSAQAHPAKPSMSTTSDQTRAAFLINQCFHCVTHTKRTISAGLNRLFAFDGELNMQMSLITLHFALTQHQEKEVFSRQHRAGFIPSVKTDGRELVLTHCGGPDSSVSHSRFYRGQWDE